MYSKLYHELNINMYIISVTSASNKAPKPNNSPSQYLIQDINT